MDKTCCLFVTFVKDHGTALADDPIEFLTGVLENHPASLAGELVKERKKDSEIDEKDSL
jgi:hypothetical protein